MERAYDTAMGNDVHIFNKVRMYLKVATISDLLTADGKEVDQNILHKLLCNVYQVINSKWFMKNQV